MTITLTREEAQQVLDAFLGMGQRAADAMDGAAFHECHIAVSRLRARLSAPEPEHRDVVIKGDLWRIEFLPDHAASVVLVRANYEAQPEPEPVTDKYLMEVECTKCGAKQDGVLTVTVPPQPEPPCKTGSQCIGGKCPQCVVSEPEPVAWMNEGDMGRTDWKVWAHGKPTATIPLYTAPSQREWQGLTMEEVQEILTDPRYQMKPFIVHAVEAKLKEKNT